MKLRQALFFSVAIFAQAIFAHGQGIDTNTNVSLHDQDLAEIVQPVSFEFSNASGRHHVGTSKAGSCGKCFSWGKDTWLSVGAGIRTSYTAMEGANANGNGGTRQDFSVNNARLYFNGQGHKRIGFEFNTDITNAQNWGFNDFDDHQMMVLDAILKFQLTDTLHLWMGRFLPPSDRSNLDGPFYLNAWNFPFAQFGYPNIFQGRDDGAALWGEYGGGVFKWQVGAFEGESAGGPSNLTPSNGADNLMFSGRVVVNLLDPEPGYYNASTYYGEKDILAIGATLMHRHDALDAIGPGQTDYTGWSIDALFERKLSNCGVVTLEGAYYNFDDNDGVDGDGNVVTLPPSFGPRQGHSYFLLSSYLFPREFSIFNMPGKFQVMGRYQNYNRDHVDAAGGTDDQFDMQLNYIMFGHNARLSGVWSHLDTPGASDVNAFTLGAQVQF